MSTENICYEVCYDQQLGLGLQLGLSYAITCPFLTFFFLPFFLKIARTPLISRIGPAFRALGKISVFKNYSSGI